MGLLKRIAGKDKQDEAPAETAQANTEARESTTCPHTAMTPRWDSVEDMGKEDRVTSYFCQGCERTFSPEEARPYLI